jgi:Protein of unknown function (DUF2442)/Domain of unknown function (DUF4160)
LRISGFCFFFYNFEGSEPPHIHVEHGDGLAKFRLDPVQLAKSRGLRAHELNRRRALVIDSRRFQGRHGTPISAVKLDASAVDVRVSDEQLLVVLADGRELAAPLTWFPRLAEATDEQRRNWRLIGRGHGIHWPDVDEDISVESLLRAH